MTDEKGAIARAFDVIAVAVQNTVDDGNRIDGLRALARLRGSLDGIHQDAEWAQECLESAGYVGGRSTSGGDRALTYIDRIKERSHAV